MMHVKFTVYAHVSPTPLQMANNLRHSVSGTLFIRLDDIYFPAHGWGDYVVPVLDWWTENVMRIHYPDSEVKNRFMDGSYTFLMRRGAGSDDVLVTLHESERMVVGQYTVSYARCLASFRGAIKSVLNELVDIGFAGDGEASSLQTRLEHVMRLESEIKAHGLP
jgi:hypothetical protein